MNTVEMAQRSPRSRESLPSRQVAAKANEAFYWVTGALWHFYRAALSGPTEKLIPAHTRDAFFQLWCDLRTNVPKDRNWLRYHAAALQPKTTLGYLALASFAAFATAGGTSLLCLALATAAVLGYALVGIAVIAGVTAGFWLLLLSGVLFAASIVVAWSASCLATGYIFLTSAANVWTYLQRVVNHRRTPLEESKQAREAVKTSSVPPPPAESHNSSSIRSAESPLGRSSATAEPIQYPQSIYKDDPSPGRTPLSGAADVQKNSDGVRVADAAAMGGPSVPGRPAAAVHPSILGNFQQYPGGSTYT